MIVFMLEVIEKNFDSFCKNSLPTHSPTRMVLGIDRLLGGFSPYILVPKNNIIPLEKLSR